MSVEFITLFVEVISGLLFKEAMNLMNLLLDVAMVAATGFIALAAWKGLNTWQRQIEFELARRILHETYLIRDLIRNIRSYPTKTGKEVRDAAINLERDDAESDEKKRLRVEKEVYRQRLKPLNEAVSKLQADAIEAQVFWGENIKNLIEKLTYLRDKLDTNIKAYLYHKPAPSGTLDPNNQKNIEAVVFASSTEDQDAFANEVEAAVSNIDNKLQRHLAPVWSLLRWRTADGDKAGS